MNIRSRLTALEGSVGVRGPEVWAEDDHDPDQFHLCDGSNLTLTRSEVETRTSTPFWLIHTGTRIHKGGLLAHTAMPLEEL